MTDSTQKSRDAVVTKKLIDLIFGASSVQRRTVLGMLEKTWSFTPREYPRKSCFLSVHFASNGHVFKDFVLNLGAGGVFIETRGSFSPGEPVTMTFTIPDEQMPIKTIGTIAWKGPAGIGVRFKRVNNNAKILKRFLKNNI